MFLPAVALWKDERGDEKRKEIPRESSRALGDIDFTKPFGMEKSKSLDFTTYFTIVQTKPCAALFSEYYPHPFLTEQRQ